MGVHHLFPKLRLHGIRAKNPLYPTELKTVGNHIRKKRMDDRKTIGATAKKLSIQSDTLINWEYGKNQPMISHFPAIISFLGYDPVDDGKKTLISNIERYRRNHGLSYKRLAKRIGIDEGALIKIVKEESKPIKRTIKKILNVVKPSS